MKFNSFREYKLYRRALRREAESQRNFPFGEKENAAYNRCTVKRWNRLVIQKYGVDE